jgi:hypothetical protein
MIEKMAYGHGHPAMVIGKDCRAPQFRYAYVDGHQWYSTPGEILDILGRQNGNPAINRASRQLVGMQCLQRPMKGYVMVDDTGMKTQKEFDYWINLCLEFNSKAKSSKKKKK